MDSNYTNIKLSKNDVYKLVSLYKNAFGLIASARDVSNKFFNNYQKVNASFFTMFNDEIVSFYGVIAQKVVYNNSTFTVCQSCDSMTHKMHSGKGLFVNLAEQVYNNLRTQDVDYVFGFPNTTIYNLRIKKLLWRHIENINIYKVKVKTLPIAKIVKKLPVLKSLYNLYLSVVFSNYKSEVSCFTNSVYKPHIACVLHDLDYFNYKKTNDKFILKINNVNLWVKVDGFLWVGDFEKTSDSNFDSILRILKKIASITGCNSIVFHYQEGTPNDSLLKNKLVVDSKVPLGFLNLTDKYKDVNFKFSASDFDTW